MNIQEIKDKIKKDWNYKEVINALMAFHDSKKHALFIRQFPQRAHIFHDRNYQLALTEVVNEMKEKH